jgi:hypothetical protein
MTAPTEREAIAQIIATEIGTSCEYLEIGIIADRIIAEHIAPLRDRASTLEAAIKRWLESPNTESFNALKRLVNHE